eukprot:1328685-Amphidinium_carterae.1
MLLMRAAVSAHCWRGTLDPSHPSNLSSRHDVSDGVDFFAVCFGAAGGSTKVVIPFVHVEAASKSDMKNVAFSAVATLRPNVLAEDTATLEKSKDVGTSRLAAHPVESPIYE